MLLVCFDFGMDFFLWVHGGGVGGCRGGGGRGWGFYYRSCGFMVVKVGGCRGDGGGRVAVRFLEES